MHWLLVFYSSSDVGVQLQYGDLIINELVTNALKYAFLSDQNEDIIIQKHKNPDQKLILTIAENSVGLPAEAKLGQTRTLGLRIVKMLTRQISGILPSIET